MSKNKIAVTIAVIAALGVCGGLLFAPQKGKKLRKKIRKKSSRIAEKALQIFNKEKSNNEKNIAAEAS